MLWLSEEGAEILEFDNRCWSRSVVDVLESWMVVILTVESTELGSLQILARLSDGSYAALMVVSLTKQQNQ
jgi:hypothetical protein